jgi:hypothetical protein
MKSYSYTSEIQVCQDTVAFSAMMPRTEVPRYKYFTGAYHLHPQGKRCISLDYSGQNMEVVVYLQNVDTHLPDYTVP